MSASDSARLDPEQLDPDAMDAHTYHAVLGPSLQVAAEVAAKRGHPTLHDDMPAMLALIEMVAQLGALYRESYGDRLDKPEMLDQAATGACVMVFQEAGMPGDSIGQCLAALETAHRQLHEHDVLADALPFVAMAWSHIDDDARDQARYCLDQAARTMIAAIEAWQTQVH